ncbi:MAG: hypothetical protein ACK44E_12360, partial [Anaerolineales bacterium]
KRWREGHIQPDEVVELAARLEEEGIRAATQAEAQRLTQQALMELDAAHPVGLAFEALSQIASQMSERIR